MRVLTLILILISTNLYAQDLSGRLAALFDTLASRGQFQGTALVGEKGNVLWSKSYGKADENPDRQLTENSVFELASVTKPFTALAVMQLKEKGLLSYSDPVSRFLTDFPNKATTLLDLINHTSGLADFTGWPLDTTQKFHPFRNREALDYLIKANPKLPHMPNAHGGYSNTNYALLALVIEKVSGQNYPAYMHEQIFAPAGMTSTAIRSRAELKNTPNAAQDFTWDGQANRLISSDSILPYTTHLASVYGAYGMTSTAGDLFLAVNALLNGKLVSKSTWEEAQNFKAPTPFSATFGWVQIPGETEKSDYMTLGTFGGFTSLISYQTESDRTIILLSNCVDLTNLAEVMHPVSQVLDGETPSLPTPTIRPKGIILPNESLKPFIGNYRQTHGDQEQLTIYLKNGYLYGRSPGFPERPLFPASTTMLRSGNLDLTFEQKKNDQFQSVNYNTYRGETTMKRVD